MTRLEELVRRRRDLERELADVAAAIGDLLDEPPALKVVPKPRDRRRSMPLRINGDGQISELARRKAREILGE